MYNVDKTHPLYCLYLNYAQRSLLGGGKGRFVMNQLQKDDPWLYSVIMKDAINAIKENNRQWVK